MRARRRYFISVVSALALFLVVREPAAGQVTVVGQQDLTFGVVIPGTPTVVAPTDAARRGEWVLTGRGNTTISFVLPTSMQGPSGAPMPLAFDAASAAWQRVNAGGGGGGPLTEDPRTPFSVNVQNRQTVRLFLGGTAQPTTTQPAGSYTATITVIVAQP